MKTKPQPKEAYRNKVPQTLVPRNLAATNPRQEQFAPTPAEPVRARYKMGGGC